VICSKAGLALEVGVVLYLMGLFKCVLKASTIELQHYHGDYDYPTFLSGIYS